ncbi:MAG TPA: carboxypeptidase regulatory-like domain-containing protein [Candidatus Angelobacter sp.]|nr:carboxypeptidase regulatory-like domain-containing protein [Candidatus Angelobacter sp.]
MAPAQQPAKLNVLVIDQNGAILSGTVVTVVRDGHPVAAAETGFSGKAAFVVPPGAFTLQAEKRGFYTGKSDPVTVTAGQAATVEVRLQQFREFSEEIEVLGQPSPIDVQQTSSSQQVTGDEIIGIPYPTTRDYRNVLPFIPGVIQDTNGQPHIAGGNTQQTQYYLDGFEVSQPAGGLLIMRVSPDSIKQIQVDTSRSSAQFGKGAAGSLSLDTQSGDNRFRFSFVDFIPTVQNVKGLHFNNWTPRGSFSGPVIKDKLWFYFSHEGEDDLNIIRQQPSGADTNPIWRTDDLVKFQFSPNARNTLTAFGLFNTFDSDRAGISAFVPAATSVDSQQANLFTGIKDDFLVTKNSLLDFGFGVQRFHSSDQPLSTAPFVITPVAESGGFFEFDDGWSSRRQGFANLFLPPVKWFGRHEFKLGVQGDEVRDSLFFIRNTASTVDSNGALARQTTFQNVPRFDQGLTESSAYLQDRWNVSSRFVLEAGIRFDHDSFVRDVLPSPRLGGAFMLQRSSETKISAGVGTYYDRTSLDLATRPLQGTRTDFFFNPNGTLEQPPIPTSFVANRAGLQAPRFLNWSVAVERKLPWQIYGRIEYMNRTGTHGFVYDPIGQSEALTLTNNRQDRYRAVSATVRKELKRGYPLFLSYTRSAAHSNEIQDFSVDNLVFGPQISGPLFWDAPNQLVSWGWLPLHFWKLDFAYSLIWRSGFPFLAVDNQQALVPSAGFFRFPNFVTLNPAIERKVTLHHYQFAVRLGINNITNNQDPAAVNNNIQSPQFRTFSGTGHRTLNARIRLLGRK